MFDRAVPSFTISGTVNPPAQQFTPPALDANQRVPRRRWVIASLLGFGVLVNYFDRVNVSVSQDALHASFGITTVQFGYLLSAYSWTLCAHADPVRFPARPIRCAQDRPHQHSPLERRLLLFRRRIRNPKFLRLALAARRR